MDKNNHVIGHSERRQFLRTLSRAVGAGAAMSLVAGVNINSAFAYEISADSASRKGLIFTQPQMAVLAKVARTLLPKTDTPSGEDLDCHGFVDHQLSACYSKQNQVDLAELLDVIDKKAHHKYNTGFAKLPDAERLALLNELEALKGFNSGDKARFTFLKELIVFGYFTSEIGATKALNYLAVPGGFKGSIPYRKGDKAWGSFEYY